MRDARPDDLGEIAALIRELAAYEHLEHDVVFKDRELAESLFGSTPAARVTIAVQGDDGVLGFALWFPTFSTFLGIPGIWLEDLFVRPNHRGRGIGEAFLTDLRARTKGRVEWSVLAWNEPAITFYQGLGAHPLDDWIRYRWNPSGC